MTTDANQGPAPTEASTPSVPAGRPAGAAPDTPPEPGAPPDGAPPAARRGAGGWGLLIAGMAAPVLAGLWLAFGGGEPPAPPPRRPQVLPVTLAAVSRGDLTPQVELTGTVRARRRASLAFERGGLLAALEVDEGARVEPGAVLARLAGREEALAVEQARTAVELARRELALLRAGARPEERRRLEAEVEVARAEAELAAIEVERGRVLLARSVIAQADLDGLGAKHRAAEGRVAAAVARLDEGRAGARPEDVELAEARLEAARTALRSAEVAQAETELRAPWRGVVVRRLPSPGDVLAAGQVVLEVAALDDLELVLDLPAALAPRAREGARVVVTLDELPGFRLEGPLTTLVPAAQEGTRNFRALVAVPAAGDPARALKPGMFARARVDLAPVEAALLVPQDAVLQVDRGAVVVRALPGPPPPPPGAAPPEAPAGPPAAAGPQPPGPTHHARRVAVRVLGAQGGVAAVEPLDGALEAGDEVVVVGADLAFPGVALQERAAPGGGALAAPAPTPGGGPARSAGAPVTAAGEVGGGPGDGEPAGRRP